MVRHYRTLLLLYFAASAQSQHAIADAIKTFLALDSIIRADGENNPALCLTLSLRQEHIARQLNIDSLIIAATCN